MMVIGFLAAIVTGLGTPANTFIFGSLVDVSMFNLNSLSGE